MQQTHRTEGCGLSCAGPARTVARARLLRKIPEASAAVSGHPSAARSFPGDIGQRRRPGLGMVFRGTLLSRGAGFRRSVRSSRASFWTESGAVVCFGTGAECDRLSSAADPAREGNWRAGGNARRIREGGRDACSTGVSPLWRNESSLGRTMRQLRREAPACDEFGSQQGGIASTLTHQSECSTE